MKGSEVHQMGDAELVEALERAIQKLPIKARFVTREEAF